MSDGGTDFLRVGVVQSDMATGILMRLVRERGGTSGESKSETGFRISITAALGSSVGSSWEGVGERMGGWRSTTLVRCMRID